MLELVEFVILVFAECLKSSLTLKRQSTQITAQHTLRSKGPHEKSCFFFMVFTHSERLYMFVSHQNVVCRSLVKLWTRALSCCDEDSLLHVRELSSQPVKLHCLFK